MTLNFNEKEKKELLENIKDFYFDNFEEEAGIIKCQDTLDFFIESLSPTIYNKALDDVKKFYLKNLDNLENEYFLLYKDK